MFARKCDRCGKLYENYIDEGGNALYVFNRDDNGEALEKQVYVKDLCPDCMEKYRQFMDGGEVIPVCDIKAHKEEAEQEQRFIEAAEFAKSLDKYSGEQGL